MGAIAYQITSLTIVYSTVYSDADQRKHQSSASLTFVRGIHRGPVNSPHKWPVTRKMFPFDDVIMQTPEAVLCWHTYGPYGRIHSHIKPHVLLSWWELEHCLPPSVLCMYCYETYVKWTIPTYFDERGMCAYDVRSWRKCNFSRI